jgi:hypothetical protein
MEQPMKSFDNVFITGCDAHTDWQLRWFYNNFRQHNPAAPLWVCDFGMSANARKFADAKANGVIDMTRDSNVGWFKKPGAMLEASKSANGVCWLDTDCHVLSNIEDIFDHTESNKLAMAEDKPWSSRRGEKWHNSGVVAFKGDPPILASWAGAVRRGPRVGDQEVLHEMVKSGMNRIIHITDLPRGYNTLRLDILDNTAPTQIKVMHWTGAKGNEEINRMIND